MSVNALLTATTTTDFKSLISHLIFYAIRHLFITVNGSHSVPKKEDTKLMAVTLSFLNGFVKFFYWHTQQYICSIVIIKIKDPTTP